MAVLGKLHDAPKELNFEWRINDFFSIPKVGKYYSSPSFLLAGEFWCFHFYPNGVSENSSEYISVFLHRALAKLPISLTWSLALKTFDRKRDHVKQFTHTFKKIGEGHGSSHLWKRATLSEKKSELVPSDILTIVCTVESCSKSPDDVGNTEKSECSHCKESFDANSVSFHEQQCLDKSVRCPTCADEVTLGMWYNHECTMVRVKATEKLIDNLRSIFGIQEHSDVSIKVKDEEFRLHRCILAGRNPYFNSMFKTDMKEKTTGIVCIDDCEPNIFRSFIHFVYTGKVDALSPENVCDLYKVADKYQEDQFKEECLCFMKSKISTENFCDFTVLALKHDEKELLQKATELFCKKTKEIIKNIKWQTFIREYPTEANELHLKALDYVHDNFGYLTIFR